MNQLLVSHDFLKISEPLIQIELLNSIASSKHYPLIEPLRKMQIACQKSLDPQVEEALEEAILQLKMVKMAMSR